MVVSKYMLAAALSMAPAAMPLRAQQNPAPAQGTAVRDSAVKTAEAFLGRLDAGDYAGAQAMVGPQMRGAGVTEDMLRLSWQQLSATGKAVGMRLQSATVAQGYQVVDFIVVFGNTPQRLRVSVSADRLVEGWRVFPVDAPKYQAPAYADATKFEEIELTVGAEGWPLGATLTLPKGVARAPVVVLVHGSGAHDRNEAIGTNQPFHDLAWGLASQGVAVLRYEKRNFKYATRMMGQPVTVEEEVIADALSAISAMRRQPRIDPARVYLLGHSLGGMLAPEIGVRDGKLAGVILLAGSPRQLTQLVLEQLDYLQTLPENGIPAAQQEMTKMRTMMQRLQKHDAPPTEDAGGAPASYFYDLEKRDGAAFIKQLRAPVLVLQGARDYQVTTQDYELWQRALAGREDAVFHLYADLNHLFMPGSGKAKPAEYAATGHMDARVITDVAAFVLRK